MVRDLSCHDGLRLW